MRVQGSKVTAGVQCDPAFPVCGCQPFPGNGTEGFVRLDRDNVRFRVRRGKQFGQSVAETG